MGTDMHILPEIKGKGEEWHPLATLTPKKIRRNYELFSLLADVRNHAGRNPRVWREPTTETAPDGTVVDLPGWWYDIDDGGHDRLVPIAAPRGVPVDASPEWKAFVALWDANTHAWEASWVTPQEVIDADWDQDVYSQGIITEREYLELRDNGTIPTTSAMNVAGPGTKVVSEIDYAAGVRGESSTCVRARWKEGPLRRELSPFLEMATSLQRITDKSGSNVRFMLLFES